VILHEHACTSAEIADLINRGVVATSVIPRSEATKQSPSS
jgi:hypothetical protein